MVPSAGKDSADGAFEPAAVPESSPEDAQAELLDRAFDTTFHMSGVQAYLEYYQIQ